MRFPIRYLMVVVAIVAVLLWIVRDRELLGISLLIGPFLVPPLLVTVLIDKRFQKKGQRLEWHEKIGTFFVLGVTLGPISFTVLLLLLLLLLLSPFSH
jgi:hypothetical protein